MRKLMKRGFALPADVARKGILDYPALDSATGKFEVADKTTESSESVNYGSAATATARRPLLLALDDLVDGNSTPCFGHHPLEPAQEFAGTHIDFFTLMIPASGVVDLLKLRPNEFDLSEALGLF